MTSSEYLRGLQEDLPTWLDQYRAGDHFPRQKFFESRIVFYPGSGTDGHPVKMFGSTHSAHCFLYADYSVPKTTLEAELQHSTHRFRGYHTLARLQLSEQDLVPNGWTPHVTPSDMNLVPYGFVAAASFGFFEVLERDQDFDDTHGARRLALLILGADAIATYDALFCQVRPALEPFAIVLHDHGFGGNYDRFGGGGLLDRIARRCGALPRWLLVAQHTKSWDGFVQITAPKGNPGAMQADLLYMRQP